MPNKTIGVIGGGELSARMIRAIFKDQLDTVEDPTDLKLILPVGKGIFTDEIETVADWATTNGVPFEIVTDGSKPPKAAEEALELATKVHEVRKIPTGLVKVLTKADGNLFVFWDEDDEVGYAAFEDAWDAEVPAYDVCNGLELLTFDEEEAEPEEDEEPAEEPEETPAEEEPEPKHEVDEWAELGRKTAKELKELCAEKGITVNRSGKGRIAKGAYLDALKAFAATGATEYYQEEDRVGGTKPRKGETEPRKPGAKEGLVTKEEAQADLADDEEPETPDDGQIPEADEDEPVELPSDAEDEDYTAEEETAEILADPEALEALAEAEAELEGEGVMMTSTSSESATHGTGGSTTVNITYVPGQAGLVGSCVQCGGPIFAAFNGASVWPEVQVTHMAQCEHTDS